VLGSTLHEHAVPEEFEKLEKHHRMLEHAHEHPGVDIGDKIYHPFMKPESLSIQNRGEYAYCACGEGGLRIFDIAFIDDKGFSERITTAPVSQLGQRFYVKTANATAVAAPTTIAPDPTRTHKDENHEVNRVHAAYAYIYVVDSVEGLITVGAGTRDTSRSGYTRIASCAARSSSSVMSTGTWSSNVDSLPCASRSSAPSVASIRDWVRMTALTNRCEHAAFATRVREVGHGERHRAQPVAPGISARGRLPGERVSSGTAGLEAGRQWRRPD